MKNTVYVAALCRGVESKEDTNSKGSPHLLNMREGALDNDTMQEQDELLQLFERQMQQRFSHIVQPSVSEQVTVDAMGTGDAL